MAEEIKILNNVTVEEFIAKENGIIIFFSPLCPHCKIMGAVLLKMSGIQSDIALGAVNADASSDIATKYNVSTIPTLLVVKNGEIKTTHKGLINDPREVIELYNKA